MADSTSESPFQRTDLTRHTLKIFWRHARVYWPMLLLCFAGTLLVICADIAQPEGHQLGNEGGDGCEREKR